MYKWLTRILIISSLFVGQRVIAMDKDPFYFKNNNLSVQLENVVFLTSETGYGFSFSFLEGNIADAFVDELPSVTQPVFANISLEQLLQDNQQLGFAELEFLSLMTRQGAVFVLEKKSNKVLSVGESPETHFLVEKSIIDNFGDKITEDNQERISQASFNVGQMLFQGYGIEQDQDAAMSYYYKSAELLNPDANYIMGALIRREGNQDTSHQFFLRGAKLGNLNSQYNVAADFFNGGFIERDLEQAFYWALIVEKRGDAEIAGLLDKIRGELGKDLQMHVSEQVEKLFAN